MRKFLKVIALLLSFVLLAGAVCSCASNDLTVSDSSESSAEDVTSESSGTISDALPDTSDTISDNVSPDVSDEESAEESDVSEDGQGGETSQPEEVQKPDDNTPKYDIVVYGDTAAAVVSAVAASRQGAKVALVAPNKHLGGMMSGGLFETDLGNSSVIGGMSREFFKRNAVIKGNKTADAVDWYFEPHVAEEIFADMLNETKKTPYPVDVFFGERLVENSGVVMSGATITKIICESGKEFSAKNFIDASYEGDLMAQAGVTYTFGREGREVYGESLAGVVDPSVQGANNHNFRFNILARDENGNLKYKEVSEEPLAPAGTGDKKIQAYNFRICLTNNAANKLPFPKPEGYDPSRYALLADYIDAWVKAEGKAPAVNRLFIIGHGVNGKHDFNNNGAFSTDYIGGNYNYPDATYAQRQEIWNDHYNYTMGLLYFLTNDPSVHADVRKGMSAWGLPKDEYTDNNNWTFQLYIREGRRMIGEYVMTQKDIRKGGGVDLTKPDTIGMGSYNSDSHNVQRYITADGYIRNEGNMEVNVDPYEIPYRMLLPKRAEADNLLVTCTFSASHVAYSTIRMEVQYMIIGEAAGRAAAISVQDNTKVHDIDITKLQRFLKENDAVLTFTKAELMNCEFEESFDNSNKWIIASGPDNEPKITQNASFVNLYRSAMANYSYITRKDFLAPTTNFTYGFRAKLNSTGKTEITVRSGEYLIMIILNLNGDKTGSVSNAYIDPADSTKLDTSVWHDYKVVVKKSANNQYTYDLYVDGKLLWENTSTNPLGVNKSSMFKIGIDSESVVGERTQLNVDVDSVYVKIN
ncbi:MAG: FAD-dependent oxidoreductase [Clostridia bacterium]|nr:FAD-dependent oxidoreductase [Clostridia bacterium]